MLANMPVAAFLWLLLGYGVASFLDGLLAAFISGRTKAQPALIVDAIMNLTLFRAIWFGLLL